MQGSQECQRWWAARDVAAVCSFSEHISQQPSVWDMHFAPNHFSADSEGGSARKTSSAVFGTWESHLRPSVGPDFTEHKRYISILYAYKISVEPDGRSNKGSEF